jgi:hypothetical protein
MIDDDENTNRHHLTEDDMIYNIQDGKIQSAGYNINSLFLNNFQSPMITKNKKTNNLIASLLKNTAIPTGLLYMDQPLSKKYTSIDRGDVISDDLYDKLTRMASNESVEENKTEKPNISKKPRNTRKQKKGDSNSRRTKKKSPN